MSEVPQDEQLPIESAGDAVLRRLGGASFGPGAGVILPSGRVLGGEEAQVFTSAFDDERQKTEVPYPPDAPSNTPDPRHTSVRTQNYTTQELANPPSSAHDRWTGDPQTNRAMLVQRALAANELNRQLSDQTPLRSRGWLKRLLGL